MAWVRTETSLFTFGFAAYKFFQLEIFGTDDKEPLIKMTLIGPREFGIVLIGIGLRALLLGTFEHRRDLQNVEKEYPGMLKSGTQLIVPLIATLGLPAFVGGCLPILV